MFKSLVIFHVGALPVQSAEQLESAISGKKFSHCLPSQAESLGWVQPAGKDDAPLVRSADGKWMLALQREKKLLPSSVVNDAVDERIEAIQAKAGGGKKISRRERNEIKEAVIAELLPRAFAQSGRTYGYIDTKNGIAVVNASSEKKAEDFMSFLRSTIESLPASHLSVEGDPQSVMTRWVSGAEPPPAGLVVETDAEFRSQDEDAAVLRCKNQDLGAEEVGHHIENGKAVVKLALSWLERTSFVLDDKLLVKRLKFLDLVQEELADQEADDEAQRFDIEFAIQSAEIAGLVAAIGLWFGGLKQQTV